MDRRDDSGPITSTGLLRRVKNRQDEEAWDEFVTDYGPYLQRAILRRGVSHADALDLVQETLLDVFNHIGDFEYDRGRQFRGWLKTIALRKAWRHWRRAAAAGPARGGSANLEALGALADERSEADDIDARLEIILGRVEAEANPLEWEAFRRTVLEGEDNREVAASLRIKVGHLFVCKSRIKKLLLRVMEETDE